MGELHQYPSGTIVRRGFAAESSLDRMEKIMEHGTKAGYDEGCHGSHCPGAVAVGMTCSQANTRFAGDASYRRRVQAGMSAAAIFADDQLNGTVLAKLNDRTAERVYNAVTHAADSERDVDPAEDERLYEGVAPAVLVKVAPTHEPKLRSPQRPSVPASDVVVTAEPAAPVRGPRWAVRRVWVAVSPDGVLHGPHGSREEAFAVVEAALRPTAVAEMKPRRAGTKWTDDHDARLRRLNGEGMSDNAISKVIGVSQSVVSSHRRSLGLESPRPRVGGRRLKS